MSLLPKSISVETTHGHLSCGFTDDGLSVAVAGSDPFVLPYAQLAQWAEHGPPEACRWGLVVCNDLVEVSPSEAAIRDRAAECATAGATVLVIRLPLETV